METDPAAREDVLQVLEKTVDFFANNAAKGERLGCLRLRQR
jgi:hypothetical protein